MEPTYDASSKLKTSEILDRIPPSHQAGPNNHPHLGSHPSKEQNQAGYEVHQSGNQAICLVASAKRGMFL
jgi:hypothetical protein